MTPRAPILVLVTVAIGVAVATGGGAGGAEPPSARPATEAAALGSPVALGDQALSSTWYCAAGTAYGDGSAEHSVVVANPTDDEAGGTLTVYPGVVAPPLDGEGGNNAPGDEGAPPPGQAAASDLVHHDFTVPAQSRVTFRLSDLVTAQLASALVEVDSGGVTVEHEVASPIGRDVAPCASSTSPTWYFAWGATSRDAREMLVLFNPFPSDVVVDAVFSTEGGVREPRRWQGFTVPARSVVGVDVGDDVTRREQVSATLQTRGGRLVVDRLQVFDGSVDTAGVSVALGQTAPGDDWLFTHGRVDGRIDERIVLYNPSDTEADVEVSVQGVDDADGQRPPQPFGVVVRPGRYEVVDYADERRVTKGVTHGTRVRSRNGVPVVAERVMIYPKDLSITPPSPVASTEWSFPSAGGETGEMRYVVMNPATDRSARVTATLYSGGKAVNVAELHHIEVRPGERARIELPEADVDKAGPDATLVVRSDGPITAERIVINDDLPSTIGPGIPVGNGTVPLATVP